MNQDESSNYDTLSNVASIGNEKVASEYHHSPFESTNVNSMQYCDMDLLALASSCLEMGSSKIKSVSKKDSKGSSKQEKYVYSDVNALDYGSTSAVSIVPENVSDFFQRSWDYDFDDTIDQYTFPSTAYSMEEIIFYKSRDQEAKESRDTKIHPLISKSLMSRMYGRINLLKVKAHGTTLGKEFITDMAVLTPMSDPIHDPQLVIDRGRVNRMQADGE